MTKFFSNSDLWQNAHSNRSDSPPVEQDDLRERLDAAARIVESVAYDLAGVAPAARVARLMVMAAEIERFGLNGTKPERCAN